MKSLRLSLIALLCTLPLTAQAAGVAVLNIQQIMQQSSAAKSVKSVLENQQKSFQSEMANKEQALQAKEKELAGQRSVLAAEEFEKKVKEFRDQATNAQREVQAKKARLDKAFAEALAEIQKTVVSIVSEKAKEKGYDAVLPTSQLLYADPALDITDEVLAQLNKKLPSVQVNF